MKLMIFPLKKVLIEKYIETIYIENKKKKKKVRLRTWFEKQLKEFKEPHYIDHFKHF